MAFSRVGVRPVGDGADHAGRGVTGRRLGAALAVAAVAGVAWLARDVSRAMGGRPGGARAERVRQSPQFRDGAFRNVQPARTIPPGTGRQALRELLRGGQPRRPSAPVPLVRPLGYAAPGDGGQLRPGGGLFVTWYGHSSALLEIEGARVLLDPVWGERCSPSPLVGPRRLHPPPVALTELPTVDAIVISHDHYDHLDLPTVRALLRSQQAPFVVPLGVGAHLERWHVPADRIIELDWDEDVTLAGLRITATEARHFSGRGFTRDRTLWASWVFRGAQRRVFYSGDTGYFDGYARIGALHGPFDVTLMQVGAYGTAWPDIHLTPEDAVTAHLDVRGDLFVPVHWATFNLALHGWSEPVDRLWREAKDRGVRLAVPRPGERIDVDDPPAVDGWWQAVI